MSAEETAKAFTVCQLKKMLILQLGDEIPRLYGLLSGYYNRRKANQGCT